jgi:hypothetical protein
MLFTEKIAVHSENHTKGIDIFRAQNAEIFNARTGGKYSNHCDVSGELNDRFSKPPMKLTTGHNPERISLNLNPLDIVLKNPSPSGSA